MAKKTFTGQVVSRSGDKTVAVEVVRVMQHPAYAKTVRRTKKYLVHDPKNEAEVGQNVVIEESRPFSGRKRWILKYDS